MAPPLFHETPSRDQPGKATHRQPSRSLQLLLDRLSVSITGGARVRVFSEGRKDRESGLSAWIVGRVPGLPPERILQEVMELHPPGPGCVDLRGRRAGEWKIRVRGALGEEPYQQRLRNVLVNS